MNLPQPSIPSSPGAPLQNSAYEGDHINFLGALDVVFDNKWLIALTAALAIALSVAYALFTTPIYEANTLIQVEDVKAGGVGSLLGDVGSMFDIKSPATAEIEILRSRLVVGQAVDNLQLQIDVRPKYLPLVGHWLSRRANEPSTPGFWGFKGYVSGNEQLDIASMRVPQKIEGSRYSVVLTESGYDLLSPEGLELGAGRMGQPLTFQDDGVTGTLTIAKAIGNPGATFYVTPASRLSVTEELQKNINIIEQGRQSGVIRSSLQGIDPRRTAMILNEIGTLYVRQNVARKAAEAEKSLNFLSSQLPQLRKELETSEEKFNQFRNKTGTFDLGNEAKVLLDQSVNLRVKLLDLQQKREDLSSRFTAEHPTVKAIDAQIRELSAQVGSIESRSKTFPNVEQDLLRLTRDVKVNNELYTGLLNSYQQLRLVKEGRVGNVRMVDIAAVPEKPIKPQRTALVAISTLVGLLAGLILAFVRNSLKPGLKDPDEIELRTGLHVFATVPHSTLQVEQAKDIKAKKAGNHVLSIVAPHDPVVESLRSLRTAFQFSMLDAANNIVLIAGPTPGIGKSFTSVNFAVVLAAANKKVLLIDADMRRGHLNQYFGLPRDRGLSEVLVGGISLADAVRREVTPNVDFLPTGILPPNPAELLMTEAARELFRQLSSQYDLVIVDTPPVLATSDAAILGVHAGAVFLVARADVSTLGELHESARRLGQAGVQTRGVIFNDLNVGARRYGFGMGYKYGKYKYTDYRY